MGKGSKGKPCQGVHGSREKCKRARDGSKAPVLLNKNCTKCGEQRCRGHCRCGRNKTAKGRAAARGVDTQRVSSVTRVRQTPSSPPAALPLAPVGRTPNPSCQLLGIDEFYSQCCCELGTASEAEVATYQYDNPSLQKVLLKRLKGRSAFKLNLYIDTEQFGGAVPKRQRALVRELWTAGATVYLCKGPRPKGSFHGKAVVIDRRYLFTGGANATYKSHSNEEFVFRISGSAVGQVFEKLGAQRAKSKTWKGC